MAEVKLKPTQIECGSDSYTVMVSKNTYTCTSGATIQVQNILMNIPFDGTIRCPDYDIVCAGQTVSQLELFVLLWFWDELFHCWVPLQKCNSPTPNNVGCSDVLSSNNLNMTTLISRSALKIVTVMVNVSLEVRERKTSACATLVIMVMDAILHLV